MPEMKQDEDDGVRELKPIQFFGASNGTSDALGVTKGMDFRPGIAKEEPVPDEITHTFQAEPGEPGVPETAEDDGEEPEFDEEPLSLLEDAPPVDDEPATDAEGAPTVPEDHPVEE